MLTLVVMFFVGTVYVFGECNFWSCIHKRNPPTKCSKWKMKTALASTDCVWNCGEPFVAPNTGVVIVQDTIQGRETPKAGDGPKPNWNHYTDALAGDTLAAFLDKENNGDKLAVLRADQCGAEYRYILHIDKKAEHNPFKGFVSKEDKKATSLDTTRDYATSQIEASRRTGLPKQRDQATKTSDSDLKAWPYNTVGLIWVGDTTGSMTLIAPNFGVTAAHVLFDQFNKVWHDISNMKFFPGSSNHWGNMGDTQNRHLAGAACGDGQDLCYQIRSITIPLKVIDNFVNQRTSEYNDWAIVELKRDTNHGYMKFGEFTHPIDGSAATWTLQSAGYPRGLINYWQWRIPFPIYKKTESQTVDSVTSNKAVCDPIYRYYRGQSGSSVWRTDDEVIEAIFFGLLQNDNIPKNAAQSTKTNECAGIIDKKKYRMWCALLGANAANLCT
eukprot:195234_1